MLGLVALAVFAPASLLLSGCDAHGCDSFRASDFSTAMELTEDDLLELREQYGLDEQDRLRDGVPLRPRPRHRRRGGGDRELQPTAGRG